MSASYSGRVQTVLNFCLFGKVVSLLTLRPLLIGSWLMATFCQVYMLCCIGQLFKCWVIYRRAPCSKQVPDQVSCVLFPASIFSVFPSPGHPVITGGKLGPRHFLFGNGKMGPKSEGPNSPGLRRGARFALNPRRDSDRLYCKTLLI